MPEKFILHSKFEPTGDQPQAIEKLVEGLNRGDPHREEKERLKGVISAV